MRVHELVRETAVEGKLDDVFAFFAEAGNLEAITPPWLHFRILTPLPIHMRAGTLIRYRLRLHGIPLRWTTKISAWEPPHRFVDEQTSGPYRLWNHEHTFHERGGKTMVRDRVRYAVLGGRFLQPLFVGRDLRNIFDYRQARILELARDGWRSCHREEPCAH